ncbi:MAG: response regulator transcription factor [Bacilli bacterium]|nr:response regulator transcription factor [Bacilli bacterium]
MHTICLVEDELDLSKLIKMYLEKANYNVVTFDKGEDAINYIGNKVDIWILDIMLKDDVNGYDIIKEIRKQDELVPVIFTSARDQDLDKILGLELGSDDYITKPYSPKELVLRVNNIIKRVYGSNEQNIIKYDNYVINLDKRKVTQEDKDIKLTTLEFDLLVYLLNNKGKQLSREEILEKVWQENYFGSDRVVDDLIRRLRKKMHINVQSIYGYGYRLDE